MAPFGARDQISAVLAFMNERGYNTMEYVLLILSIVYDIYYQNG